MKLIKHGRVSASISDAQSNLSVLGVFQIVQDAVTEMMGRLEIDGITAREKYNAVWVFTRNRTRLFKTLPWSDDEFTVTAFVSIITRATISVDTSIRDCNGDMVAYSRIEMCPLDLSTMRIRRVETVGVTGQAITEQPETDITFTKFDCIPTNMVDEVRVGSTNIDMSQHTNNVEYLRFILNTYTVKQLKENKIREIEIRYVNQSYENDRLCVYMQSEQNKDLFLLTNGDKDIVKCEVLF